MTPSIDDLISFLQDFASGHPGCKKDTIAKAAASHFGFTKKRSVYSCDGLAIRFSAASGSSFSNVVLSLSALLLYDRRPFIVCVVRPGGLELLLANSTFLKKISHSSQQLRTNNIRGSFLGHDIFREYDGIRNIPANFSTLFLLHSEFTWQENLGRLVEATNNISPTGVRFEPTPSERSRIISAAELANDISRHSEYADLASQLSGVAQSRKEGILKAAEIDNVNERGNFIEQIITEGANVHGLADLKVNLNIGTVVFVDVKTKLLALSSSPKGYNIDKVLVTLAQGKTVFSFFFLGIDLPNHSLQTCLVSILDQTILSATRIQFHWAGRNSRGVTQLAGDLSPLFSSEFRESVDVPKAKAFLQRLIDLKPLQTT